MGCDNVVIDVDDAAEPWVAGYERLSRVKEIVVVERIVDGWVCRGDDGATCVDDLCDLCTRGAADTPGVRDEIAGKVLGVVFLVLFDDAVAVLYCQVPGVVEQ
ncbi:hypothetical protein [Arthrobacter echini]|uniref:hypothetical protein n=1 Tax=Arthrobacter echini TaxID=1529066 RepID=UPI001455FC63|nr:hypothetical protein [Arthrobacter echini]